MAGDRALSMLIDIRARDSASSIVRMLGGVFSGFGLVAKQAGLAFGLFGEAKNLAGMAQLAAAAGHTSAATYLMGQSALKSEAAFGKLRQAAGTLAMSALKLLAAFALVAVVIGIGIGVVAVNAARNFQQQMLKVQALTGASTSEMQKMNAAILAMAPAVGIGPTALAKALYPIESDGFKGAAALNILRLSAIAAKVGLADVNTVAYALTSGIRAFGFADSQATYVMNIMNNTVRQGKMEWSQYAVQVGRLATAARTSGVSFIEANAALSTLTQSGSTAAKATTFLINLFNQLNLKTDAMAKHAAAAGIAFNEQKFKTMDLAHQIDYLTKITHGSSSEMMKLMGNNSIAVRAYELLAKHSKTYADILKNLNASQKAGNDLMASWATTQQGFNIQLDKVKAGFDALLITLGTALLPVLGQLLGKVTPMIQGFIAWEQKTHGIEHALSAVGGAITTVVNVGASIVSFFQHSQVAMALLQGVLITAALFIAGFLVAAFIAWAIAAGTAAIATLAAIWPFILIGIAIALVVAGIILAVKNWGAITKWFQALWHTVWTAVSTFFVNLWHTIISWITTQWNNLKNTASTVWHNILTAISNAIQTGKQWIVDKFNAILKWIKDTWNNFVSGAVQLGTNLINAILSGLKSAWNNVVSWFNGAVAWVKGLFPGSPVEHGALKGYENWGYTFGMGIADGIRRSVPHVQSASALLAASMGGNYQGSYSLSGSSFGGGRYPTGGHTINNIVVYVQSPDVKLDGVSVTDKIMRRAGTDVRRHGGPIRNG